MAATKKTTRKSPAKKLKTKTAAKNVKKTARVAKKTTTKKALPKSKSTAKTKTKTAAKTTAKSTVSSKKTKTATAKKTTTATKKATTKTAKATRSASIRTSQTSNSAAKKSNGSTSGFTRTQTQTASPFTLNPEKAMETIMGNNQFQFDQFTNEASAFSRENMEAFVQCGNIWFKGVEDIISTAASLAQTSAEKQSEYVKQALSAKTLNEWAETQNKIVQASFDDFMQGATKMTEISVKVVSDAAEPFNAQVAKTMKKTTQNMAA